MGELRLSVSDRHMPTFEPSHDDLPGMRKIPWRFIIYALIILYLAGDLYLFRGPLRRRVDHMQGAGKAAGELAAEEGIVASVNAHPIYRQELDRAMEEYSSRRGLVADELPRERANAIRWTVLRQLVEDRLIWFHSHHTPVKLGEEELAEARVRFRRGFASEEEFETAAAGQGFDLSRLDAYLQNQTMQREWVEQVIARHIVVSDEEISARLDEDPALAEVPERVRARHIFLATLDKDAASVKSAIDAVAQRLAGGEEFAKLARELSEDERSKREGGELGWLSAGRLPEDFAAALFALEVGEDSAPFQTRIGWHIAEVVERRPARQASLEELRPEIVATIEAEKRGQAIDALLAHLKAKAKIRYFGDFLWVE